MIISRRLNTGEKVFLLIGALFVLFLVLSAMGRNVVRHGKSILGTASPEAMRETLAQGDQSKLHLQSFYRVQIERGRQLWEIRASEAKYFPEQDITFLSESVIVLQRKSGGKLTIKSRSAKLNLKGENLVRADLEGNVIVEDDAGNTVKSELAVYDSSRRLITLPGDAVIDGTGYHITSIGLEMQVDSDKITLLKDVRSRFDRGANVPKLMFGGSS